MLKLQGGDKLLAYHQVLLQVVDAAISESMFNMLEGCIPELVKFGFNRPPSGSTITGWQPSAAFIYFPLFTAFVLRHQSVHIFLQIKNYELSWCSHT